MADIQIALLRDQLARAFDTRAWHGPNLMGSLRGVDREIVAWRPQPPRHNIAELVVHAAYWKYRVHRLLSDAPPRSFDLPGSNFFPRPDIPSPAEWNADLDRLRGWHGRLLTAVDAFAPERLIQQVGQSRFSYTELIAGAAAHDVYHAGQIQLIKRLYAGR